MKIIFLKRYMSVCYYIYQFNIRMIEELLHRPKRHSILGDRCLYDETQSQKC